jgi:hypothetical protein
MFPDMGNTLIYLLDDESATEVLELVRYASAHAKLPFTDGDLCFIAVYPEQERKILAFTP